MVTERTAVARYGDVNLLIDDYEEEGIGRDYVTQSPHAGDRHVLQDRGRALHRTRCSIIFCDEPTGATYQDRWLAFRTLAASVKRQLFVHPDPDVGTFEAAVADLSSKVSGDERCVRASCTFIETSEPKPVQPVGAGTAAAAGPEAVAARAAAADSELAKVGTTSSAPAACSASATAWAGQTEPDARAISLEAASLTDRLDALLGGLTSPTSFHAYRAVVLLRYAVARAAAAVTSETARVATLTLAVGEPLLSLCARVYGARDAQDRARQVQRLNGLRTAALVPAGTSLKMPVVPR